jgi:hypothetical protein
MAQIDEAHLIISQLSARQKVRLGDSSTLSWSQIGFGGIQIFG